jgi:hypothetical protein
MAGTTAAAAPAARAQASGGIDDGGRDVVDGDATTTGERAQSYEVFYDKLHVRFTIVSLRAADSRASVRVDSIAAGAPPDSTPSGE